MLSSLSKWLLVALALIVGGLAGLFLAVVMDLGAVPRAMMGCIGSFASAKAVVHLLRNKDAQEE